MKISGFSDTIEWYNQNAAQYAEANSPLIDMDQIEEFCALLPPGAKILDAGCAAGRDSNLFQQRDFQVSGVDASKGLIDIARSTVPKVDFVQANFLNLPFQNEEFDGIWSHQSLLHLETQDDVKKALSEFHRVLRPNGILLVLVKAQDGDKKTAVVSDSLSGHDRFFQYFTKEEMHMLLTKSGFKVKKLEQYSETDKRPEGRPEVSLVYSICNKL